MIIGVPLFGSIINARIFTSISIKPALTLPLNDLPERFTNSPVQAVCLGGSHRDIDNFAFEAAIAGKVYYLIARRVPRQIAFGSRALFLNQHRQSSADVGLIDALLDASLCRLEFNESHLLFVIGNVISKVGRGCAGTFRILEDVDTVVFTLLNQIERLAKVFVGFTRKADDDVARQRETAPRALDALDALHVIIARVAATHQFENAIAP